MADEAHKIDFSFPFHPYDIQLRFMAELYEALESSKCGIFESPTGTGKSLSLICGSLTWLNNYMKNYEDKLNEILNTAAEVDADGDDWFAKAAQRMEGERERKEAMRKMDILKKQKLRVDNLRKDKKAKFLRNAPSDGSKLKEGLKCTTSDEDRTSDHDEDLILDEYHSDAEDADSEEDEEPDDGCLKVFYCSRTHSQLTQFVREVQKTAFANETRIVPLASRQNLCINDEVTSLKHLGLINDKCIELQKYKSSTKDNQNQLKLKRRKTGHGCPYYKAGTFQNLADQFLLQVQDLEEIESSGRKAKCCPYYSSRFAIRDAQLVVLPYHSLLHKGTREASSIRLKGNVVIIDEAHNLLETIANIHSAVITSSQLCGAHAQLQQYMQRYEKRLTPKNLLYIKQIIFFLKRFIKLLAKDSTGKESSYVKTVPETLCDSLIDNLDFYKLLLYIDKSKLCQKLHGFSKVFQGSVKLEERHQKGDELNANRGLSTSRFLEEMMAPKESKGVHPVDVCANAPPSKPADDDIAGSSPLLSIAEFMRILVNPNSDGRILVQVASNPQKSCLKYLLLNPASQFHDIVRECRSVIVAGGTMSPMQEFREQLFVSAGASQDRIVEFTCGHVVSSDNVLPVALGRGPSNVTLDFTYNNRLNPNLLDELGRILVNLSKILPGGVVCFLPSYEYEEKVFGHLLKKSFIDKLSVKKKVFREPKKANQLDKVLGSYVKAIKESRSEANSLTGAILFCVVGGKMSEGINFSDDLGRCVVMVGLPYPNKYSPELKEKMQYLNLHHSSNVSGKSAGSVFYENLCFKAVNQSIGRSIRHKDDYASILLLDQRYGQQTSKSALPSWIGSRLAVCDKFGVAFGLLRKFFAGRNDDL